MKHVILGLTAVLAAFTASSAALNQDPPPPAGPGWLNVSGSLTPPRTSATTAGSGAAATATTDLSYDIRRPKVVQALAKGLQDDPRLIYEYVHDVVEYVPYYGALKGETLTLLDKSGNDCDIACLAVALLREAGYTARIVYGTMTIPNSADPDGADMQHWLGLPAADAGTTAAVIETVLANGGIPALVLPTHTTMERFWVTVNIEGTDVVLDPAFKSHDLTDGIDLAAAVGYIRQDLLAAAGGIEGADYVKDLDTGAVQAQLGQYAQNLAGFLQGLYPNAAVEEIVGGRTIRREKLEVFPTAPRFPSTPFDTWDVVPAFLVHTARFQIGTLDHSLSIPSLGGRRLAVTFGTDSGSGSTSTEAAARKPDPIPDNHANVDFGVVFHDEISLRCSAGHTCSVLVS